MSPPRGYAEGGATEALQNSPSDKGGHPYHGARDHLPRRGRPRVVERPGFSERWAEVGPLLLAGTISHGEAARRLDCSFATVLRLVRGEIRLPETGDVS